MLDTLARPSYATEEIPRIEDTASLPVISDHPKRRGFAYVPAALFLVIIGGGLVGILGHQGTAPEPRTPAIDDPVVTTRATTGRAPQTSAPTGPVRITKVRKTSKVPGVAPRTWTEKPGPAETVTRTQDVETATEDPRPSVTPSATEAPRPTPTRTRDPEPTGTKVSDPEPPRTNAPVTPVDSPRPTQAGPGGV